jgi:hypothetical protein
LKKANIKHQSDHEKLKMRNWTNAASWIKQGKNPYEALESKVPDPPRVGEQGPEVKKKNFLIPNSKKKRISWSPLEKLDALVILPSICLNHIIHSIKM